MKRCFAVVNSSVSEGMSAAILEVNTLRAQGELDNNLLPDFSNSAAKHYFIYF